MQRSGRLLTTLLEAVRDLQGAERLARSCESRALATAAHEQGVGVQCITPRVLCSRPAQAALRGLRVWRWAQC